MRRTWIALGVMFTLTGVAFAWTPVEAKYTTKEVMKKAHGGGRNSLLNKVRDGRASDEEKTKLVEYYEALAANKPKKGDPSGYTKLCDAMVTAAKAAQKGEKNAPQLLGRATNCKACHDIYK